MRRWQTFSLFALLELVCSKNVFHPILLFPTNLPQASSPLECYGRTTFFTPCSQVLFFSLAARGPTCRRNSIGLAKLWGGWPIKQVVRKKLTEISILPLSKYTCIGVGRVVQIDIIEFLWMNLYHANLFGIQWMNSIELKESNEWIYGMIHPFPQGIW